MLPRVRFAVLYALAWTPLAALYALVLATQPRMDVMNAIVGTAWTIGSAALLGAVAWWISTRVQYDRSHWAGFLILHGLLSIAYGAILTAEIALSIKYGATAEAYQRFMREAFGWQVLYGIALYGLVVGISYALQAARRLRDEERRAARSEALRIDAELRALRAQLNPHFLFNTLHSIT
ncbi:MAG TPA: histidine kinase, partial [Gemmatimonadaceae bacterium]|nr:histidine kinase [Gemmatimonadaceae bacterium]